MRSYLLRNKRRGKRGWRPPQANPRQARTLREAVQPKKIAAARASGADGGAGAGDAVASRNAKSEAASDRRRNPQRVPPEKLLSLPLANPRLLPGQMRRLRRSVRGGVGKKRQSCCRENRSPNTNRTGASRRQRPRLSRGRTP